MLRKHFCSFAYIYIFKNNSLRSDDTLYSALASFLVSPRNKESEFSPLFVLFFLIADKFVIC